MVASAVSGGSIHSRVKGALSTWLKSRGRACGIAGLDDLLGFRIVVPRTRDCYRVLEAVSRRWSPVGPVTDRIERPKANGYRSLHGVFEDPRCGRFELQIRTRAMHRECESGRASHAMYKAKQWAAAGGTAASRAPSWLDGSPAGGRPKDRARGGIGSRFRPSVRAGLRSAGEVLALLATIGLIGALDVLSGQQIGFAIFYLLPVSIASWRWGSGAAIGVSALSTLVWWLADRGASPVPFHPLVTFWNAFMRFGIFALLGATLARLREALAHNDRLAHTDHLTGLPNSRAFFERAAAEIEAARRTGAELTVGFLDLDDFGALNHQLGHAGADRLLSEWASVMARRLRPGDTIARIGGDEFAVLLPHTCNEDARVILERLWSDLTADVPALETPVQFSLGAVTFARPPRSVDALLHEADVSMFAAKAGGKGRWHHERHPSISQSPLHEPTEARPAPSRSSRP